MESRNYRVIRTLATGGTAVLYHAVQTSLDREVVIKRLHSHLTADCNFTRRFEVEAKAAASLDHENIVRIIDSGVSEGNYFIVMEYIDGPSLAEVLERRGKLDATTALLIAREVCLGLDHAHRRGIVHRDIKPANIMITREGTVKITDFGLAKLCRAQLQQTVADTLLGTPLYMSPEQAVGESVDGRSDLFSLGTICYEMLTGEQPFIGETYAAVIQNIIGSPVQPLSRLLPSLDAATERIVMKSLSRDPAKRFESAEAMRREIESAVGIGAVHASRERLGRITGAAPIAESSSPQPRKRSRPRRRRRRWPAVLTAAAACIAGAVVLYSQYPDRVRSLAETMMELWPKRAATEIPEALPAAQTGSPGLALYIEPPAVAAPIDTTPPPDTTGVEEAVDTVSAEVVAEPVPDEEPAPAEPPAPPPPAVGLLEVRVSPEADVFIDGRPRGSTDRFGPVELTVGRHELILRQSAFREYHEVLYISRGELSRRRIELMPVTGGLDFVTIAGATVVVSGEKKGQTPLGAPIVLPAGRYLVELRKHGYMTWSGEVEIPADETLRLRINLVPEQ